MVKNTHNFRELDGDPCRIRTCDNLLRRQVLYPAELRDRFVRMRRTISKTGNQREPYQCVQGWVRV
jgi:hypothetical protein